MKSSTTKKKVLNTVEEMPEDETLTDIMERFYLQYKVERGLKQVEEGKTVSPEEAKEQAGTWQE